MTIISNDPTWWLAIDSYQVFSYFLVASFVVVMYDWALTFGQEVELVWGQRWSLMTLLYLSVRFLGILLVVYVWKAEHCRCTNEFSLTISVGIVGGVPAISLTDAIFVRLNYIRHMGLDACCGIFNAEGNILMIFLTVTFLADNIFNGVVAVVFIIVDAKNCSIGLGGYGMLLDSITWILGTVWEILALCLAAWIAVKHFRELQQHSAGGIIKDCVTVLMETHMLYFASLVISLSPTFSVDQSPLETQIYYGLLQILEAVQSSVLGPRLILGVREYHARLVAGSDAATSMTSIAFQEHMHISTDSVMWCCKVDPCKGDRSGQCFSSYDLSKYPYCPPTLTQPLAHFKLLLRLVKELAFDLFLGEAEMHPNGHADSTNDSAGVKHVLLYVRLWTDGDFETGRGGSLDIWKVHAGVLQVMVVL
ncbi:hypothetical protein BDR05DRAFT_949364 [Suillus weaverae]|nr:hypothetical protein BDR05DRAFT_949364 [Suillus weaverae]